jgi:hypothetical protein
VFDTPSLKLFRVCAYKWTQKFSLSKLEMMHLCIVTEKMHKCEDDCEILGKVHLDLQRCYELKAEVQDLKVRVEKLENLQYPE